MRNVSTPYRSVLYTPGSNENALKKSVGLSADGLIIDLEDSVVQSQKDLARELVCKFLKSSLAQFKRKKIAVRINSLESNWGEQDLKNLLYFQPDIILIPKVEEKQDLENIDKHINSKSGNTKIWAMIETPLGVLNSQEIATVSPNLTGLVIGTNDLIKDLGVTVSDDRVEILSYLNHVLLAARAFGLVCLDGVYNAFQDELGFRNSCIQSRRLGFDGKTLIHPKQIDIANEVFSPNLDEINRAKTVIREFEKAQRDGRGVAVVEGEIVESLHVKTAKSILQLASNIDKA